MKNCIQCGESFSGRANKEYCSNACKGRAERERRKDRLSDGVSLVPPVSLPSSSTLITDLAGTVVQGVVGQVRVPQVATVVNTLQDATVSSTRKMLLVGGICAGGMVGYQIMGKGKRFSGVLIGGVIGGAVVEAAYRIFYPELKLEPPKDEVRVLADMPKRLYSASDIRRMEIPTIITNIDGVLARLVGSEINEKFSMLLYGEAGSGKSHLATMLASELGCYGRVLYVLAEEEITNSVQQRINLYECNDRVKFLVSNNEQEILDEIRNFDFLILDSLNGLLRFTYHTDFLRRLKSSPLRGLILLNQVNKQGQFVGNNTILHEVDVEIRVTEGRAVTGKNRFGISDNVFDIFMRAV